MKTVTLPDGAVVPALGQGTWYLGEQPKKRQSELNTLRWGAENGMTLIDTAEMYGEGLSEELVGEAISTLDRSKLFLVSKVYPWNAGKSHIFDCCDATLSRMGTDHLDLYLLHWRGGVPLRETVACMEELKKEGKIRRWGVSNFDLDDMHELLRVKDGENCAAVQDLYHLGSRGVDFDLLPFLRREGIPLMAYCPLAQGGRLRRGLTQSEAVMTVAQKHNAEPLQILLAFVLAQDGVIAIPRASQVAHVQLNRAAADIVLTSEDLAILNKAFPAPTRRMPLDMV